MDETTFANLASEFEAATDQSGGPLRMHSLMVKDDSDYFLHSFTPEERASDIRSLSKTVLTLIAGVVSKQNPEFTQETLVWPYLEKALGREQFEAAVGGENLERWRRVKVKHLLSHTTGFDQVLLMRGDLEGRDLTQLVEFVVSSPLVHEPGEHYLYSNAGFYLLSVVLQEFLGEDLGAWAGKNFFTPLGIEDWRWEKYGDYLAGATRLWLHPTDLMKVGEVLLAEAVSGPSEGSVPPSPSSEVASAAEGNGVGEAGAELLARGWVNMMKTPTMPTPKVDVASNSHFRRHAYGSGLWVGAKDGIFFGHGTGGQSLAIVPKKNAVVITLADQGDVKRLEQLVEKTIQSLG